MTYQWYKDGNPISGATSSTYTILTVLGTSAGVYSVKVTNAGGSVMSDTATLDLSLPPTITTQPQSQQVTHGQNVSFSVVVSGSGPFTYQWRFNNYALSGATAETLGLTNVQPSRAGNYTVVIADSVGSVTSAVATLTVYVPPAIATQPQSQALAQNQHAYLYVVANGSAALAYQWNFNGAPVSGATDSTLALGQVQPADAGSYTVVVTNNVGSVTSVVATVTVTNPVITLSPSGMTPNGFSFQASVPVGLTYVIFASTDLQAWTPIATNVAATANVTVTDPAATNHRSRFYRALVR
jgi:hypothetical protein